MAQCRLIKQDNGIGYTPDSVKTLNDLLVDGITEADKMSQNGTNLDLYRLGIKKMLRKIGDSYHNQDLDALTTLVEGFLKSEGLDVFIPQQGVRNTMSKAYRKATKDVDLEQYVENSNTWESIEEISRQFMDKTFGALADIKNEIKQQAAHKLINCFIIDRENSALVTNIVEANNKVKHQKNKLYEQVVQYLNNPALPKKLFDGDKYTYALEDSNFKVSILKLDSIIDNPNSEQLIEDLYTESHKSEDAKKMYDAVVAWFTLKNFDNFINSLLGNSIEIDPSNWGKFTDENYYKYSQKGTHLITNWRTNEDDDTLEMRVNKLVQILVSTTPLLTDRSIVNTGQYLKFEDFYRIVTKIKDLALDPRTSDIYLNPSDPKYSELFLDEDSKLFAFKSLRQVINSLITDPQKYSRLVFKIFNSGTIMNELDFTQEEKNKCWSIYKGIFDNSYNESIKHIQNKYDNSARNYYSAITQVVNTIYSVDFLQYNNDEGVFTLRSLRDLSTDNTRRDIESNILRSNSRRKIRDFESVELQPFAAVPTGQTVSEGNFVVDGMDISLNLGENILTIKVSQLGQFVNYYLNGTAVSKIAETPEIIDFIDAQLHLNFKNDVAFKQNYLNSNNIKELTDLSATVLFNKYISAVVLKDVKGPKNIKQKLNEIFGKSDINPGYNSFINEMNLIPKNKLSTLDRISKAKQLTTGEALVSLVRNAEGDALATQTMSRLLGSLPQQHELLRNSSNSVSHFSILKPGFYLGYYNIKELKSALGNKEHTQFTVSEYAQGQFLYAFVRGFMDFVDYSKKNVFGNGKVGLMPSVNSDKNTIGVAKYDLNTMADPESRWIDLSAIDVYTKTSNELYRYYRAQWEAIKSDFNVLSTPEVPIDFDNNFEQFNAYCRKNNIKASDKLYELVLNYNTANPNNPIHLIDQVHYIKNGNDVQYNNTIKASIQRYENPERFQRFIARKEADLLKSLVDENVVINLYDIDEETPKKWLIDKYPDWIGKKEYNNGRMTLAKIQVDGQTKYITDKRDLYSILEKHDLYSLAIQLHPMLSKWNAFDFLTSQEFLITSVGSHIAHKTKIKNTPIVAKVSKIDRLTDSFVSYDLELKNQPKEVWEQYVTKAASQNKILVTELIPPIKYTEINAPLSQAGNNIVAMFDVLLDNEIREEAGRFLAQHKRNVSLTAAMHAFQLNSPFGIPSVYNMAVMDDIMYDLFTFMGDKANHAPFDGCTFVHPYVNYWENNSLEEDRAGTDKKQFVHYYDEKTGTGGIVKTAGFAVTNDLAKQHQFYRIMAYNMMKHSWYNANGTPHVVRDGGILIDFEGNSVDYGDIYFKRGNKYFKRNILQYNNNNTYTVKDVEVDIYGDEISDPVIDVFKYQDGKDTITEVTSNYDVWQLFGGWNSLDFDESGKLIPSEKSLELGAEAASRYGIKKPGVSRVDTADDIEQPMKYYDMHYMPTVGAIKQGAANINPSALFYKRGPVNFMKVKMRQAGIQLDKEHHADKATLSLMTQVMSGLASRGFTFDKANKAYTALYNLTKIGTKDFRNELGDITDDTEQFDAAVSNIILQTILNSSPNDGDLLQTIAKNLIAEFRTNKNIKLTKEFSDKIDLETPYSSPAIYNKLVTALTSSLTKAGIRQEVDGILAVLNPTQDAIKLYTVPVLDEEGQIIPGKYKTCTYGKLEEYFDLYGVDNEKDLLNKIEMPTITNKTDIEIGRCYLITRVDGTQEVVYVNMPNSVKNALGELPNPKLTPSGNLVRQMGYKDIKDDPTIISLKEWLLEGRDLKSYNIRFSSTTGESYQLADLDIVQDFFDLKKLKGKEQYVKLIELLQKYNKLQEFKDFVFKEINQAWNKEFTRDTNEGKLMLDVIKIFQEDVSYNEYWNPLFKEYVTNVGQKILNSVMQNAFLALSQSSDNTMVKVGGNYIQVDSIKVQNYGCIMPKTFKSSLGLSQHDDLETIKNDREFFVKRLADKFTTRVENIQDFDEEGNEKEIYNFHLELKRNNGKHIYIRAGLQGSNLSKKVNFYKITDFDGRIWRCDSQGNKIYQLYSDRDEIYLDSEGNEIIVTYPDYVEWTDLEGNIIKVISENGKLLTTDGQEIQESKNGVYVNISTGQEVFRNEYSGLQFYLDTMSYNSLYFNKANTNEEFQNLLNRALTSYNHVAKELAEKINKLGYREKTTEKAIEKQRELSDQMYDYRNLLKLENNEDPIKQYFFRVANNQLTRIGHKMHTSFMKTLNILAARIPAQNQQSFMAMEVEGYENPDVNSAYVSTYQFYLQGSDLDVDAVSMQTYSLSKNGVFEGFSPYYQLNNEILEKASQELPFPTGQKVKVETGRVSTLSNYLDDIDISTDLDVSAETTLLEALWGKPLGKGLFNFYFNKRGDVKVSLNLNSAENIAKLGELLSLKTIININSDFIDSFKTWFNVDITPDQEESINKQLEQIINAHNMYLTKLPGSRKIAVFRNYLTQQAIDLISDPSNIMEAMSSVDAVTETAKALAQTSPKANAQNTFSIGNVMNKLQSISENMVGKDGIAICATALKSFFAFTQMHNKVTRTKGDVKSLLQDVKIGGKVYKGLANVYTPVIETEIQEYDEYLYEQSIAADASNDLSAFLSLSVDNAKKLSLAKLNAGTSTIGMYLYGLSLGVPVSTLYKIIASPLGFRLAELTKGDSFNEDNGTNDIVGALDYVLQEPTKYIQKFDSLDLSEYNVLTPSLHILQNEKVLDILKEKSYDEAIKYFESLRSTIKSPVNVIKNSSSPTRELDATKYEVQCNGLIDFLIQYVEDVRLAKGSYYNTVYGSQSVLEDFETLALGAQEMKQSGKLFRLNQEVKTNPRDLVQQVGNIENALIKRISQLKRYKLRHGKFPVRKFENEKDQQLYNSMVAAEGSNYKKLYKIDFERFIIDPTYRDDQIHLYDLIKASYNPLKVFREVDHYKGYLETLYIAYQGWKNKSIKFNVSTILQPYMETTFNIYDSKLKEQVGKNIENQVDLFLRSKWLQQEYKPFYMPASTKTKTVFAFSDNVETAKPLTNVRAIQLGTTLGDANYKLWFEEVILPDLQKRFPKNKFIQDLRHTVNPRTISGTISTNIGLPANMMPRSEYEKDLFNQYKKNFNDLSKEKHTLYSDAKGTKYPVQELIFLYSLITTGGRVSQTSLFPIFKDYMQNPVAKSYNNFISAFDAKGDINEILKFIQTVDLLPFSTRYRKGSDMFKEFDKENEEIRVWQKVEQDPNQQEQTYEWEDVTSVYYFRQTNTDYFLHNAHLRDFSKLDSKQYPTLSKFNITTETLLDGSERVVSITSEDFPEKAKMLEEFIIKHNKGKLFERIVIDKSGTKSTQIDLQRLEDESNRIECNV